MSEIGDDPEDLVEQIPNAADPVALTEAKKVARLKADQVRDFWLRVMADPIGRLVQWQELVALGTFEDRFAASAGGFPDQAARDFYAGQKAYGLRKYRTLMLYAPGQVILMHQEHDPDFQKPKPPRRKVHDG